MSFQDPVRQSDEPMPELEVEQGHVLFVDVEKFSKMPMDGQREVISELQEIVRRVPEFAQADNNNLIKLPAGDGIVLVFFGDPTLAFRCARHLAKALRDHPHIKLRMGIHTGPVYRLADINKNWNIPWGAVNLAQRVMDCGDAGHILLSRTMAETIAQLHTWKDFLHDLGEVKVKHGIRIQIFNAYFDDFGNPKIPKKLQRARRKKRVCTFLVACVAAACVGYLVRHFQPRPEPSTTMTLITSNGKVTQAAISPDSKYIAYTVQSDSGTQALFVHQIETDTDFCRVQPAPLDYEGVTFSPGSSFIYYAAYEGNLGILRRIPLVGGAAQIIVNDIDSPVIVSPNGKQIGFIRRDPLNKVSRLMLAAADGSFERTVATRAVPADFSGGLAWFADKTIAAAVWRRAKSNQPRAMVIGVRVSSGQQFTLTKFGSPLIGQIAWMPPAPLALVAGNDAQSSNQLIEVETKSGMGKNLTDDANTYLTISTASDGTIAAVQKRSRTSAIWIARRNNTAQAQRLTPDGKRYHWIAWTSQGIITETDVNGTSRLVVISTDGLSGRPLGDKAEAQYNPRSCGNRPYIVFTSPVGGSSKIWRMDADEKNSKRLTNESATEGGPVCTPDGKWVIYNSDGSGQTTLWKVPVDGGNPIQIMQNVSYYPEVSPDGKYIVSRMLDAIGKGSAVVLSFTDGTVVHRFDDIPDTSPIKWGPGVADLTFVKTDDGVSNLFIQPLFGGGARQITRFNSEQIFAFDWSHSLSQLAILRGVEARDVAKLKLSNTQGGKPW